MAEERNHHVESTEKLLKCAGLKIKKVDGNTSIVDIGFNKLTDLALFNEVCGATNIQVRISMGVGREHRETHSDTVNWLNAYEEFVANGQIAPESNSFQRKNLTAHTEPNRSAVRTSPPHNESAAQQPENLPSAVDISVNEDEREPTIVGHGDFRARRERGRIKNKAKFNDKAVRKRNSVVFSVKCCRGNCRQLFENKSAMMYHVSSYHARGIKKTFQCYLCRAKFIQKANLTIHMNTKHPKPVCPPQSEGEAFRRQILRSMHGSLHRCAKCKIPFATKKSLQCHKYLKHKRRSLSTESLRALMKVKHTKKAQYKCPKCPNRYFNDIVLLKHWAEEHAK